MNCTFQYYTNHFLDSYDWVCADIILDVCLPGTDIGITQETVSFLSCNKPHLYVYNCSKYVVCIHIDGK